MDVMNRNLRTRSIVIAIITLGSLILMFGPWNKGPNYKIAASDFFKPSNLKQNLSENIHLGLDLRGGTHLVMQVQADEAIQTISNGNVEKAKDILTKGKINFTDVKSLASGQVVVETADASQQSEIKDKLLADFGSSQWSATTRTNPPTVVFDLSGSAADRIRKEVTEQAKAIIEQRINQFGVTEPTVQFRGRDEDHQILLQMPGVDNPERVKELLKADAKLELKPVKTGTQLFSTEESARAALAALGPAEQSSYEVLHMRESRSGGASSVEGWYILEKNPLITGADLRDARGVPAQGLGYHISFQVKPSGAEKVGAWTEKNVGNYLAIVLGNQVKSAPVIKGKFSDSAQIEGSFTQQEAEDLALVLRSGALPTKILYLEERTVGPSLGADSIRQGVTASIVGMVLVVFFMLFYYKFSGVNAVVALVLNLIILLAGLAVFNATLTLPGIAGVILTIGMAVDSNVLIFERIREELRAGKIVLSAVDTGFSKALVTIIDTHVTTIVSALFLYFFGTGPIRGFAVTLVIGLLANLFTAVYVSRAMFIWTLTRGERQADTLSI